MEGELDRATITVDRETKEEAQRLKRSGLTWDAFLNDLLGEWKDR